MVSHRPIDSAYALIEILYRRGTNCHIKAVRDEFGTTDR